MRLDDLVPMVKRLINKKPATWADNTGDPDNETIISFINIARNELYNRLAAQFPSRFASSEDATYTGGSAIASLPSSTVGRQIVAVWWYTGSPSSDFAPLSCKNVAELANLSNLRGWPAAYVIQGSSISLRPVPSADVVLRFVYIPVLTDLSSAANTPSEFPADQHSAIAILAAAKIATRNMDATAEGLNQLAKESASQLHDAMRSMVGDDGYVISAPPGPFDVY
jgi:hypothetical protein